MNETKRHYMLIAMRKYGGSFVKALAECFEHADPINAGKLERAFPEYFAKYIELGKNILREELNEKPPE